MAYSFSYSKKPITSILEIAEGQLDKITHQLLDQPDGFHIAVHEGRKRMKKLRALLRLLRPALGEDNYKKHNVYLRDQGRKLAHLRDSKVKIDTLQILQEKHQDELKIAVFKAIQEQWQQELEEKVKVAQENNTLEKVGKELQEEALKELNEDLPPGLLWVDVLKGQQKTCKRARKRMAIAYKDPGAESFHAWRKRVKYFWYQYRLMKQLWPQILNPLAEEIKKLSDYLGDLHDIDNLIKWLPAEEDHGNLLQWAAEQQGRLLRAKAQPLGERLLTLSAKKQQKQVQSWLKTRLNEL